MSHVSHPRRATGHPDSHRGHPGRCSEPARSPSLRAGLCGESRQGLGPSGHDSHLPASPPAPAGSAPGSPGPTEVARAVTAGQMGGHSERPTGPAGCPYPDPPAARQPAPTHAHASPGIPRPRSPWAPQKPHHPERSPGAPILHPGAFPPQGAASLPAGSNPGSGPAPPGSGSSGDTPAPGSAAPIPGAGTGRAEPAAAPAEPRLAHLPLRPLLPAPSSPRTGRAAGAAAGVGPTCAAPPSPSAAAADSRCRGGGQRERGGERPLPAPGPARHRPPVRPGLPAPSAASPALPAPSHRPTSPRDPPLPRPL